MQRSKISVFLPGPSIGWGGSEIAALRVLHWLQQRGFKAEVLFSRIEGRLPFSIPNTISVVDLRVPMLRWGRRRYGLLPLSPFPLAKYLKGSPPFLVTATSFFTGNPSIVLARWLSGVNTKVVLWEQMDLKSTVRHSNTLLAKITPQLVRLSYPHSDCIIASSLGVANSISELTGINVERIKVIHNPSDPEIEQKANEPLDHPWFQDGQPPIILGAGRLHTEKDFPTLIQAFALVRQSKPCRLVILGEGEERPKLEALIKKLKLENDVFLPGFEPNPFKFMKRAAVFVLSSKYEGFGIVLAEALACGCPIVSTDCPSGPSEILENGKWGKLVPVGNVEALAKAILETIDNPPDREKLKERGMDFHIDKIGRQWLELINLLAQKR